MLRINELGDREPEMDVSRYYITIFTEPKGEKELTPVKNSRESCRKRVLTTKCGEKKIIYIDRKRERQRGRLFSCFSFCKNTNEAARRGVLYIS